MFTYHTSSPCSSTNGHSPPAISLLAFLVVDMLLNFYSIAHFDSPIPGGSVLIRCVLIFGYIFIFFAYLASNGPFPSTYSFWGIKADLTSVVIYVFIWIIRYVHLLLPYASTPC